MRSVIISLILFALTLFGAISATNITSDTLTKLCADLHTMENQIIADQWTDAQQSFDQIRQKWQNDSFFWRLMLSHETLMDIEANLLRVGAYTYAEDFAQSMAELASLYAQYEQLLEIENLSVENIL